MPNPVRREPSKGHPTLTTLPHSDEGRIPLPSVSAIVSWRKVNVPLVLILKIVLPAVP